MKKNLHFLMAALALLVNIAIPMGVWGQSMVTKTYKLTIDYSVFNSTSYDANNNEKTSYAVNTSDNTDIYEVKWTSNQIMKGTGSNSTKMQWKKNEGKLYNSTDLGTITSVLVTNSAGTFTTQYGESEQPGYGQQGYGKGYFKTTVGAATGYSTKVEVVFEIEVESTDPSCVADEDTWDFGGVNVGQSSSKTFTVTTANLTSDLTLTVYDDEAFRVSPASIASNATSTEVTVTFSPKAVADWVDALVISGDDFNDDIEVPLTGSGLCNSPANALAYTTPINLTLTGDNVSTTLEPTTGTGNGGSISYEVTTNPGSAGSMSENTFTATATGTYVVRATQALNGTTCGGTADITINVTGTTPSCAIDPTTYNFGTVLTDSTQTKTFTVTTANLEGALTVAIDNTDKGFSVSPASIAQNAVSTEITVTYNPTVASDEVTATLTISGGGLASNTTATVRGTASDGNKITFNAGTGYCSVPSMTDLAGNSITLPEASTVTAPEGWIFAGWCATNVATATTTQPTLLTGSYTIAGDATLYAVYSKTEGSGDHITYVFKDQGYSNSQVVYNATMDATSGIGWSATKGGNNEPAYYTTGEGLRVYNGGSFSVTTNGNTITAVSLTFSSSNYTFSSSVTDNPTTWSGSQSTNITWSVSRTCRLQKVEVTYNNQTTTYHTSPTAKVETPTISVAGVSTGAANTYYETATVTLVCETDEATIYYTTNGDEPTSESSAYSEPFAVTDNATIKAIAMKTSYDNSDVASQAVSIVHRNATFTDGVYTSLTSSTNYNEWYSYSVSGDNQKWGWSDGSKYAYMYGNSTINEDWLISPKMQVLNNKLSVSFDCATKYGDDDQFEVYYSTNYPGYGNPTSYTWTEADVIIPNNNEYTFETKDFCLTGSITNVYIAFKYVSTTTKYGTLRVNNFNATHCYPVTYAANGGTGTMTDSNSPYAVGATVTTLANTFTAPEGYIFERWSDGTTNYNESAEFTMPNHAVELSAQWIEPCTVTATMAATEAEAEYVNDAGDKSYKISMNSKVTVLGGCDITEYGFVYSTSVTMPTIDNATKLIVGNDYTTVNTEFDGEIANATQNATYYIRAYATNAAGTAYSESATSVEVPDTYPTWTISYSTNGNDEANTSSVDHGDALNTFITPTAGYIPSGYTFAGWSTEGSVTTITSITPTENTTLYAVLSHSVSGDPITVYQRMEETTDNWSGDYLIVCESQNKVFNGVSENDYGRCSDVTITDNTIENNDDIAGYVVKIETVNDGYTLKVGSQYMNWTSRDFSLGDEGETYTIAYYADNDKSVKIKYNGGVWLQYNTSGGLRSYTTSQTKIQLYKKTTITPTYVTDYTLVKDITSTESLLRIEETDLITVKDGGVLTLTGPNNGDETNLIIKDGGQLKVYATDTKDGEVQATVEKNIIGYGNNDEVKDGWNFIASPINDVNDLAPTSVTNMTENNYDLYQLNNTSWENYKEHEGNANPGFNLTNGRGYLYANSNNVTLEFAGTVKPFVKDGENTVSVAAGWNLVGNPFTFNVYADVPYYAMNAEGTGITANTVATSTAIAPCTSIVIKAENAGTVKFSETSPVLSTGDHGNLQMVLAHKVATRDGASVNKNIDNAIVSFNEGSQLGKFYFGNQNANIFIPQNGEDYAIAFSDRQGDVPLYFKANETGTYTISFAGVETNLNGIHLIDILAEEEIDLSVNPSYTFIGSPADMIARFKIVFRNTGGDGTSDIFAYQNGSDIVVTGEGELQIFDVMGRMVSTQRVNGVGTVNVKSQGVYIFRLNEKTQKIVVR